MLRSLAGVVTLLTLAACAAPQSAAARAQDSARELNLNARFGRNELVVEHLAPSAREAYMVKHRGWGGAIRIADSDLVGMNLPTKEEAIVTVKIAWYRQDEQELRITTLRQRYHDYKGEWLLVAEDRADGDIGLLGEKVVVPAEASEGNGGGRRQSAQFPTIHLSE